MENKHRTTKFAKEKEMKTETKYRQDVKQIGQKLFYFNSNLGQNFNDDWPPSTPQK